MNSLVPQVQISFTNFAVKPESELERLKREVDEREKVMINKIGAIGAYVHEHGLPTHEEVFNFHAGFSTDMIKIFTGQAVDIRRQLLMTRDQGEEHELYEALKWVVDGALEWLEQAQSYYGFVFAEDGQLTIGTPKGLAAV